jgi:hypothetical protein
MERAKSMAIDSALQCDQAGKSLVAAMAMIAGPDVGPVGILLLSERERCDILEMLTAAMRHTTAALDNAMKAAEIIAGKR